MVALTQPAPPPPRPPGVVWAGQRVPTMPRPEPARTHWKPHNCTGCGAPATSGALQCAYCRRPS